VPVCGGVVVFVTTAAVGCPAMQNLERDLVDTCSRKLSLITNPNL